MCQKKGMINTTFVKQFAHILPFFVKKWLLAVEVRNHDYNFFINTIFNC